MAVADSTTGEGKTVVTRTTRQKGHVTLVSEQMPQGNRLVTDLGDKTLDLATWLVLHSK